MPRVQILSLSAHAPLWKMSCKEISNVFTKKEVYQFQVSFISHTNLRKNAFKEKCISVYTTL